MTDPDRDDEFEAYLRRRSVLTEHEPAAERLEPPQDLDEIVLHKARQAIHQPTQMPLYRAPRWALPVALAATILLTFSIILNVSLNARRAEQSGARGTAALAAASADSAPATSAATVTARQASAPSIDGTRGDPQAWLKLIDTLRARGKNAEADDELRRFRAAFPDYVVKPAAAAPSAPTK